MAVLPLYFVQYTHRYMKSLPSARPMAPKITRMGTLVERSSRTKPTDTFFRGFVKRTLYLRFHMGYGPWHWLRMKEHPLK